MSTVVTKKQVESLIRKAVKDRGPETVGTNNDGMCVYYDKGKPVCLVGQVVSYLTDKPLGQVFRGINTEGFDEESEKVEKRTGLTFTDGAKELLNRAQDKQDTGYSWGQVKEAILPSR